jgi:hypothetical protein
MLKKTLNAAHSLLEHKGVLVIQTLNFAEIRRSGFRFFPLKGGRSNNGSEVVFARFFEPIERKDKAIMVFASFLNREGTWTSQIVKHQILQLDKSVLEKVLCEVGFSQIEFYSSYTRQPFLSEESRNLVSVATK